MSVPDLVQGIYYFATHRYLWPLLRSRLLPCFVLSLFVFGSLFLWTYLPQVVVLLPFHDPAGAFVNAAFLVLGEGAIIIALLFEGLFVDDTLASVFDAVLLARGCDALVAQGRAILPPPPASRLTAVERLGLPAFSPVYSPFSFKQIAEFVLLLPLNFVPFVGVPAFLRLTGARAGPLHHHRYFRRRGLAKKQRRAEVRSRRLRYTWFGTAALVLQLVPGLSMVFLLTTAAGSALWVADLETEKNVGGGRGGDARTAATTRPEGAHEPAESDPLLERSDAV